MATVKRAAVANRVIAFVVCLAACLASVVVGAAEGVLSVESFEEQKSKWDRLVGTTLRIEGRYSVFNPSVDLRFENCQLRFRFAEPFPTPRGSSKNVEVTGSLRREAGKLVFLVTDVRETKSDLDELRDRRAAIDTTKPAEWYAVADWALQRGRFYNDRFLLDEASEAIRQALLTEFRQLDSQDFQGVRKLLDKAKSLAEKHSLTLSERFLMELRHDACRREWAAAHLADQPDFDSLLTHIIKELPGSEVPLTPDDAPQHEAYRQQPRDVYAEAEDEVRARLHRMLYVDAATEKLERMLAADGRNGDAVADLLLKLTPELAERAAAYRDRQLAYDLGRAGTMTRQDLNAAAIRLEKREATKDAERLKRLWLESRTLRLRADGPQGIMELGDDYANLLGDMEMASKLYIEVADEHPELALARDWLEQRGYRKTATGWEHNPDAPVMPDSPLVRAAQEGRLRAGMSASQTRSVMGGAPARIVRIASQGAVVEVWMYMPQGVAIEMVRASGADEPEITAIRKLAEPAASR